jgi:hypothetical protein
MSTICQDYSKQRLNASHYAAIWIWLGWFFLIPVFFCFLPIMAFRMPSFLRPIMAIVGMSVAYPLDMRKQPKVLIRYACYIHIYYIFIQLHSHSSGD